jgi:hypothetical protein
MKSQVYIYNIYLIEKLQANLSETKASEEMNFEKIYNSVKKVII